MNIDQKSVQQRIESLKDLKKMNQSEFAKALGIQQSDLSSYLSGKKKIGITLINRICLEFSINKEWLQTGKGDVYQPESTEKMPDLIQYLEKELEKKDQKIAELNQEIGCLRTTIKQLENISVCGGGENKKEAI